MKNLLEQKKNRGQTEYKTDLKPKKQKKKSYTINHTDTNSKHRQKAKKKHISDLNEIAMIFSALSKCQR